MLWIEVMQETEETMKETKHQKHNRANTRNDTMVANQEWSACETFKRKRQRFLMCSVSVSRKECASIDGPDAGRCTVVK